MRKTSLSPTGPRYEVVDVTPALAEKWLKQNTHNRNLREVAVYAYARDMEAGKWTENGEAVKFAANGTLLDGQHRLQAVTLAGVTVRMLVVTGLDNSTQETMDDGRKRTLADALSLRGETNSVALGAVLRRVLMWDRGIYRNHGNYVPTTTECLTFLAEHPHIRDSAAIGVALRAQVKMSSSILALSHWLFAQIDAEDAVWFFDRLGSGVGLEQYHPVWTLRKRAVEMSDDRARTPEDMVLAFVIKAWNAYRDGEPLRLLRFKPGGAKPEKFPLPK